MDEVDEGAVLVAFHKNALNVSKFLALLSQVLLRCEFAEIADVKRT